MKLTLAIFLVLVNGCLCGCLVPMTAQQLAGYTEPGVDIKVDAKSDGSAKWSFKTTSDFKGSGFVDVGPEPGRYKIEFKRLTSDATSVTEAQGERATALIELRTIEAERMIQQQKLLNEAMMGMVSNVLTAIAPLLVPKPPSPPSPPIELPPIVIGGGP